MRSGRRPLCSAPACPVNCNAVQVMAERLELPYDRRTVFVHDLQAFLSSPCSDSYLLLTEQDTKPEREKVQAVLDV